MVWIFSVSQPQSRRPSYGRPPTTCWEALSTPSIIPTAVPFMAVFNGHDRATTVPDCGRSGDYTCDCPLVLNLQHMLCCGDKTQLDAVPPAFHPSAPRHALAAPNRHELAGAFSPRRDQHGVQVLPLTSTHGEGRSLLSMWKSALDFDARSRTTVEPSREAFTEGVADHLGFPPRLRLGSLAYGLRVHRGRKPPGGRQSHHTRLLARFGQLDATAATFPRSNGRCVVAALGVAAQWLSRHWRRR